MVNLKKKKDLYFISSNVAVGPTQPPQMGTGALPGGKAAWELR